MEPQLVWTEQTKATHSWSGECNTGLASDETLHRTCFGVSKVDDEACGLAHGVQRQQRLVGEEQPADIEHLEGQLRQLLPVVLQVFGAT
jgi:hypothetical protein